MIVHTIAYYKLVKEKKGGRYSGHIGGDGHKKDILERTLSNCHFNTGDMVTYNHEMAFIDDIFTDMSMGVEWDGLKPLYIALVTDANTRVMAHHADLNRNRKH